MPELELRYPTDASTLDELERILNDCPPWAVRKFAVVFEGTQLDYGAADNLLRARRASPAGTRT